MFDDFTLQVVLQTVDTITDFVAYLTAKEQLLESGRMVFAAGEEELLAHYLKHTGPNGLHRFAIPDSFNGAWFDEGSWEEFEQNPQRHAQLAANEVSYAWDNLIEKFTHYATTGEQEFANYKAISDFERGMRFMAREPRTKRRMLAKALLENMTKPAPGLERATRVGFPTTPGDPYYLFLAMQRPTDRTQEDYRVVRRNLLHALCMTVRARWQDARDVIGIATDPLDSPDMSEDLAYLDGRHWSEDLQREAEQRADELGLLKNLRMRQTHEKEYPDVPGLRSEPVRKTGREFGRNEPCPCRSGRKYKRCCGRIGR